MKNELRTVSANPEDLLSNVETERQISLARLPLTPARQERCDVWNGFCGRLAITYHRPMGNPRSESGFGSNHCFTLGARSGETRGLLGETKNRPVTGVIFWCIPCFGGEGRNRSFKASFPRQIYPVSLTDQGLSAIARVCSFIAPLLTFLLTVAFHSCIPFFDSGFGSSFHQNGGCARFFRRALGTRQGGWRKRHHSEMRHSLGLVPVCEPDMSCNGPFADSQSS